MISRFKKERFLKQLSEDDFRDQVVRPLFHKKALNDGRDLCGPSEAGKDCLFLANDALGMKMLYVVQTKRGNLNLGLKPASNLIAAVTQIRTALQTNVILQATAESLKPSVVVLCVSGKINAACKEHILKEISDPRIRFMDADDIVPEVDTHYPEFWLGIDAEKFPYLRSLLSHLSDTPENSAMSDLLPQKASAASDSMFVQIHLIHPTIKIKKINGQIVKEPSYEQMPVTSLCGRKERHLLLLGDAGAGKSTSLRRIAITEAQKSLELANGKLTIPVVIRAIDLSANGTSLIDIASEATKRHSISGKPAFSTKELRAGSILILIDALDEVPLTSDRKRVLEKVLAFSNDYPLSRIIISSRDYVSIRELPELATFSRFNICAIDLKQAKEMVQKLHRGIELPQEKIKETLRRLQSVHGIELNPLLVTVFVATSDYDRRDIPANITELFKKFTEMMLGRWEGGKGMSQQYHAPLKDFLVRSLAYKMHQAKKVSMPFDEAVAIITEELKSRGRSDITQQLLDEVFDRSGLFRRLDKHVEFRHHLLQEFFAGRGIADKEFVASVIDDQWWQRAVVFYFGEHPDDHASLGWITERIDLKPSADFFTAAVTTGLALQAAYLVKTDEKIKMSKWVIDALVNSKSLIDKSVAEFAPNRPLTSFLAYYILGRDAVACDAIVTNVEKYDSGWIGANEDSAELRKFWLIIAFVECGHASKAEELVKDFTPKDRRLLLALHVGFMYMKHLRVANEEEKSVAEKMISIIQPRITGLRQELLKEIKTEIVELQQGKIQAIEEPENN